MFVYIWKDQNNIPFYVGFTKHYRRTNPRNSGRRNEACLAKIEEIGLSNIIVELREVNSKEEGKVLEASLIAKYGRKCFGDGSLTNIGAGGEGVHDASLEYKLNLSKRISGENNPVKNPKTVEKIRARLNDPDVKEKFLGDNNPAKRPESRKKLKAVWDDPIYREAQRQRKLGKPIHTEEEKNKRRLAMQDPNHPLNVKAFHTTLNSDPDIKAKRVAGLRTPENRARQSAQMKEYWAKKRAMKEST